MEMEEEEEEEGHGIERNCSSKLRSIR